MSQLIHPVQLQRLAATQLLDRTIWLYRENFWTFLGITALVQLPVLLIGYLLNFIGIGSRSVDSLILNNMLTTLGSGGAFQIALSPLLLMLLNGAFQVVVIQSYFGEPISIFGSYRRVLQRFWGLLLTIVALLIVGSGIVFWFFIPILGTFTWLGMILFFLSVVIPISICTTVSEELSAFQAVDRAWQLTRKRIWPSFGFALLLGFFTSLAFIGPNLLIGASSFATAEALQDSSPITIILTVVSMVFSIILRLFLTPIPAIAMGLYYFDLRIRLEGLDLALRIKDGKELSAEQFLVTAPKMIRPKKILTMQENFNFFVILLILVAIYAALIGIFLAIAFAFSI